MKQYNLITEFLPQHTITYKQYIKNKEDILNHLKKYYDYKIINSKPIKIIIYKELKPYEAFNSNLDDYLKTEDYNCYVADHLSAQFMFTSKTRMARQAIQDFGHAVYNHNSVKHIVEKYINNAFSIYGERSTERYWVYSKTYTQPSEQVLQDWYNILRQSHIGRSEALISLDEDTGMHLYSEAVKQFKQRYNDTLVSVYMWRRKKEYTCDVAPINTDHIKHIPLDVNNLVYISNLLNKPISYDEYGATYSYYPVDNPRCGDEEDL